MKRCVDHDGVDLKMPKPGDIIKQFENHNRKIKVPFVVVGDFECVLEPIENQEKPSQEESFTIQTQKHKPVSFDYIIKCFDDKVCQPILREYVGKDSDKVFIKMLTEDIKEIHKKCYQNPVSIKITEDEEKKHENEKLCWICNGEFTDENYKVRDHCHFTGKYRGAAHTKCNLKAKIPNFTPVFFHNLSGYDAHLFIKYLGKTSGYISCIPNNEEKYISFTKYIYVEKK